MFRGSSLERIALSCVPEFMATIKPFAALRPQAALAGRVCELPYDVMSSNEAHALAAGNQLSFLYVSKPEIDLPKGTDIYAPRVYAAGRERFQRLIREGAIRQDAQPGFYLYRQILGQHSQVGIVAGASCQEYLDGFIKKHELTRVDKEDDRVRHIEAVNAQTGPAFLTYRTVPTLDAIVAEKTAGKPDVDFTAPDGVRHSSWAIFDADTIQRIQAEFARLPCLYIADGHHRSAAAGRIFRKRSGAGESATFLAVIFPHRQMQILPYHRVLQDLNRLSADTLLARLGEVFEIRPGGPAQPERPHQLGFFLRGQWRSLTFRKSLLSAPDPVDRLDVTLLQKLVLQPLFGIEDPRTSKRINFVGGIRGTGELERLVKRGEYACAFSLFPTSIDDLMAIADAGGLMPPKSTWFEPKLRDGMFCHLL